MSMRPLHLLRRCQSAIGRPYRSVCTQATSGGAITLAPPGDGPNHRSVMALDGNTIRPFVQPNSYIAPSASIIGSVIVNDKAAVLYGAVVRGDLAVIHIGFHVVIGENATLSAGHMDMGDGKDGGLTKREMMVEGIGGGGPELMVGDYSVIGAGASLKGCILDGENMVGSGVVIEDGARLGRGSEVLPGSVVEEGVEIGECEVWGGAPARKVGTVSVDERAARKREAEGNYAWVMKHSYEFLPVGTAYWEKESMEEGLVSTPLIRPDGGRPNISAKTLATLWYLLILPDAQKRLQAHLHHKRLPWYSVTRMVGVVVAAANVVAMPLSWSFLFAGKRNASRVAAMGVLMNPPSFQLSYLFATELSHVLVKRVCIITKAISALVRKPFKRGGDTGKEEGKA